MMAVAMLAAVSTFAQGTVDFKNIGTAGIVFDTLTGANAIAGTTFRVQLYYVPDQTPAPTSEQLDRMSLGASATLIAAGFFTGGARTAPVTHLALLLISKFGLGRQPTAQRMRKRLPIRGSAGD